MLTYGTSAATVGSRKSEGRRVTTGQFDNGAGGGPIVVRMLLGAQLRRLREAKGITREKAGYEIRSSDSKISRMELGRVSFKLRDVADLLTLYGVEGADQTRLMGMARQANSPAWWQVYNDVTPTWFQSYLGLEAGASLIRTYEVQFIPGLLQTPDYARAVVRIGHGSASADEIERRVALRIHRQELLTRENPPLLWAMVDEAALRRPMGGKHVMRAQIGALMDAIRSPSVRLQIIPFEAGGHAATGGAFSILRFADKDLPDIVYVEQLDGAAYLDKPEDVDRYAFAMERLVVEAEPPSRTAKILRDMLRDFD
jgi:transcriptional regulator with XRE-family HTH domain